MTYRADLDRADRDSPMARTGWFEAKLEAEPDLAEVRRARRGRISH